MNKLDASQVKIAYKFKNVKLKLLNTCHNIKFNKTCFDQNIIPKYVQVIIRNKSSAAKKAKSIAETVWIKNEIKSLYRKKNMLNTLLMKKHIELLNILHPSQHDVVFKNIDSQVNKLISKKKKTQEKKINSLIEKQSKPLEQFIINHQFFPRVKNCTNITFNDDEIKILNKGLKHNIQTGSWKRNLISEILNAEIAISSIKDENSKNYIRHLIDNKVKSILTDKRPKHKIIRNDVQHIKAIKEKLVTHNCIITKADKGQCIVIMSQLEYNDKVLDFIKNNNIKEIPNDPTDMFQLTLKNVLNKTEHILNGNRSNHLKMIKPRAPVLRGLPKIHKDLMPVRPLVNFTSAPTYKITKTLDKLLRNNIKFNNNHSLKNSLELIDHTSSLKIEDRHTLASLDIVNLYTNVPIQKTLDITRDNLLTHSELSTQAINELIELLKVSLSQNYFTFNGKFYLQEDGLAMGSPLSSILSEIYLNSFENEYVISETNKFANKIILYKRYVDDTLIIFNGNSRQLTLFTNYLNSISKHLQFTLEIEQNNSLNFLDLKLTKNNNDVNFKIYRKPTTTDHTIHASSNHPQTHKMAAYNSFVNRLLKVPMSQTDFNNEYLILKQIAVNNGYPSKIIDTIINKQKSKNQSEKTKSNFACIEFGNNLHFTLKNELKKHNITLASKTSNKLERHLNRSIKANSNLDNTGVYKLSCSDCPKIYIGQTGRSFTTRFGEHLPKPRLNTQRSNFAEHLVNENHSVNSCNENLTVLHKCTKGPIMNVLESYEIYKALKESPQNVLNEKLNFGRNILFDRVGQMQCYRTNDNQQLITPLQGHCHQTGIG